MLICVVFIKYNKNNFIQEISAKISQLKAVQFVADIWRAIKTRTIQNSFKKYGFTPIDSSEILRNEETEDMLQVPIANSDEFLTIGKNLPCHDDNEDCEDSIVEDDDEGESPVPVTN